MSQFQENSVFWIEIEKVKPNPYQPRREFDEAKLKDLAESIRMYGILQPLVVTRNEVVKEDGGLVVEYELISGERRLRASKIAGLTAVPSLIRTSTDSAREKLELAIIENLQREDLNAVDRARSFQKLVEEFGLKHIQIAEKMGKSREYVSNTLRLLALPEDILKALSEGRISEGHTRPLLMLNERKEEQLTLFKEIIYKKLTVREAEAIARRIAYDKVRKKERAFDPEIVEIEEGLTQSLGTRVQIERRDVGGKIVIDFFSHDDLRSILDLVKTSAPKNPQVMLDKHIESVNSIKVTDVIPGAIGTVEEVQKMSESQPTVVDLLPMISSEIVENIPAPHTDTVAVNYPTSAIETTSVTTSISDEVQPQELNQSTSEDISIVPIEETEPIDDRPREEQEQQENEEELYSVKNFSI